MTLIPTSFKTMPKILLISILFFTCTIHAATPPRYFPVGVEEVYIADTSKIHSKELEKIAPLVKKSITEGYYPGMVILAVHNGDVIYRGVFGHKRILPDAAPMDFNTIFDVASLTKVIVTTTAVMQLVEQGKLKLNKPVAKYWPAFAAEGKGNITIKQLLTHTSGLPEGIPSPELNLLLPDEAKAFLPPLWEGKTMALDKIIKTKPLTKPDTKFRYSDINFLTLGYLVELVSGEPLNKYAEKHIFKPLGMNHTYFLPPPELQPYIAPTQTIYQKLRWGEVHDSTAHLMGGVSGMAGLFSNANDLGIFAQMLLDKGRFPPAENKNKHNYFLKSSTVKMMTTPQTPKKIKETRGLGWDINSPFTSRGTIFSTKSFGHTGWTGTSMWIDPTTNTFLIILTSRTHPTPAKKNKLIHDRRDIADMVARSAK